MTILKHWESGHGFSCPLVLINGTLRRNRRYLYWPKIASYSTSVFFKVVIAFCLSSVINNNQCLSESLSSNCKFLLISGIICSIVVNALVEDLKLYFTRHFLFSTWKYRKIFFYDKLQNWCLFHFVCFKMICLTYQIIVKKRNDVWVLVAVKWFNTLVAYPHGNQCNSLAENLLCSTIVDCLKNKVVPQDCRWSRYAHFL